MTWRISSIEIDHAAARAQVFDIPEGWEPFGVTDRLVWIRQEIKPVPTAGAPQVPA